MYFSLKLCYVSKYDSELSHVPSPARCTLRSCVIRSHARPWPASGTVSPGSNSDICGLGPSFGPAAHYPSVPSRVLPRIRPAARGRG